MLKQNKPQTKHINVVKNKQTNKIIIINNNIILTICFPYFTYQAAHCSQLINIIDFSRHFLLTPKNVPFLFVYFRNVYLSFRLDMHFHNVLIWIDIQNDVIRVRLTFIYRLRFEIYVETKQNATDIVPKIEEFLYVYIVYVVSAMPETVRYVNRCCCCFKFIYRFDLSASCSSPLRRLLFCFCYHFYFCSCFVFVCFFFFRFRLFFWVSFILVLFVYLLVPHIHMCIRRDVQVLF